MDLNWDGLAKAPMPTDDFDQYFAPYNEIDDLFNETLTGLQDLDVPLGFVTHDMKHPLPKHSRKQLGTAIFGFAEHNRELSINGMHDLKYKPLVDLHKSVMPGELLKSISNAQLNQELDFLEQKPILLNEEEEQLKSPMKAKPSTNDYIVTNENPTSYKFPSPEREKPAPGPGTTYSVKYLKELQNFGLPAKNHVSYADDIEPLLFDSPLQLTPSKAYVPIPVQQPAELKNLYLPPPLPPTLLHGLPEWLSPEPQSPSPARLANPTPRQQYYISPNRNRNFYNPQFFSDSLYDNPQLQFTSLPYAGQLLNSSPIRIVNSPLRNTQMTADDTVDANATIQMTPVKNKMKLEWSPIVLPDAKRDVRLVLDLASPRRRVKKTSLLPPGELDQYWEGPDEEKCFTCTYKDCGKKFTRRYNVRSHIQTHLSDRPFACMYCPKKFVRQHDLNRHVKGHLEARHCICPCGKEFSRLDAMRKHRARNICIGGVASSGLHCVTKPKKRTEEVMDGLTSDRLAGDIEHHLEHFTGERSE